MTPGGVVEVALCGSTGSSFLQQTVPPAATLATFGMN
jgi:hypothetical protein